MMRKLIVIASTLGVAGLICYLAISWQAAHFRKSMLELMPVTVTNEARGITLTAAAGWKSAPQEGLDVNVGLAEAQASFGVFRLSPAESHRAAMAIFLKSSFRDNPKLHPVGGAFKQMLGGRSWVKMHAVMDNPKIGVVYYATSDADLGSLFALGIVKGELSPVNERLFDDLLDKTEFLPLEKLKTPVPPLGP